MAVEMMAGHGKMEVTCAKELFMKLSKQARFLVGILLLAVGVALLLRYRWSEPSHEINRARLAELMEKKLILSASLAPTTYPGVYFLDGTWKADGKPAKFSITTHLEEAQVKALLDSPDGKMDVPGRGGIKGQEANLISVLVVAGLVGLVLAYQMRLGKGKGAHRIKARPLVRFKDVAGIEEAKAEVQEVVDFLRNPKKYKRLGGSLPKGILLIGPPGTGKTMLAKAIAGEAQANFFSAHGSDFNEVFVGVGARRIRDIFRQAARHKPAIIFIDEIDCLGKNRKFDTHGELQQTNNALLAAMDGFESSEGLVVVGATNRPEDLDEALMRPGRFDRKVLVPYPDMKGRQAILETHAVNKPIEDKSKALAVIAQTTPGLSGADLANLMNEAAILCAQQNCSSITLAELEASRDKVRFGKERKSMVIKESEREMIACHEAGHAIVNLQKKLLPPLYKVSIIPRGSALGVTTLLPDEDQNIHSKELLLQELAVLMGGRAAEKVFYHATTNGANGDLDAAKKLARRMVHDWGMGQRLYYEPEKTEAEVEINRLLEEADREALAIIEEKKEQTALLARNLLLRETLTRAEVVELITSAA
jgi:cell division protease FtsH